MPIIPSTYHNSPRHLFHGHLETIIPSLLMVPGQEFSWAEYRFLDFLVNKD